MPETARRQIGVCFDTCHAAVQFEDVAGALKRYLDADVRVAKVQLSAAAAIKPDELKRFADHTYLHQTKAIKSDGSFQYWNDLPAKVDSTVRGLRVHFHVPLFAQGSTASELTPEFFNLLKQGATEHLEIETYTFDVLPSELRSTDVVDAILFAELDSVMVPSYMIFARRR